MKEGRKKVKNPKLCAEGRNFKFFFPVTLAQQECDLVTWMASAATVEGSDVCSYSLGPINMKVCISFNSRIKDKRNKKNILKK